METLSHRIVNNRKMRNFLAGSMLALCSVLNTSCSSDRTKYVVQDGDVVSTLLVKNGFLATKDNIDHFCEVNDIDPSTYIIHPGDEVFFDDDLDRTSRPVQEDVPTRETADDSDSHDNDVVDVFDDKHSLDRYEQEKSDFGVWLSRNVRLQEYDIHTPFGMWARSLRFHKDMVASLKQFAPSIDYDSYVALNMQESRGNTAGINPNDGGAGFFHIQPDVAKKDYGMKIFTDDKQYRSYDYDRLYKSFVKKGVNKKYIKRKIYRIHGKVVKKITSTNDGYSRLANLDDRWHVQRCNDAVAKVLQKNYDFAKKWIAENKHSMMPQYKRFSKKYHEDFLVLCALNGFNKGAGSFLTDFDGTTHKTRASKHIVHIINHKKNIRSFNVALEQGIKKGLTEQSLWDYVVKKTGQ